MIGIKEHEGEILELMRIYDNIAIKVESEDIVTPPIEKEFRQAECRYINLLNTVFLSQDINASTLKSRVDEKKRLCNSSLFRKRRKFSFSRREVRNF